MMDWPFRPIPPASIVRVEITSVADGTNAKEPCPLCNGLCGWDRSGRPVPLADQPEWTKCHGCAGSGIFCGWLRDAMSGPVT